MTKKKLDVKSVSCNYEIIKEDNDSRFSRVKILVAHTGWNYNGTYFSKEMLTSMANNSLGKIPIVGFLEKSQSNIDFAGHEEEYRVKVTPEGEEEIELVYLGRPFGFVPPNPDFDFEMVNTELGELEYLVTYGYVWNKFEGSELFDEAKNHSMELLPETLDGDWVDKDDGQGGWKITTATFDALCVLGDSHAPAMAGSMIEKFSHKFNKKSSLKRQFEEVFGEYSRVENEGGEQMEKEKRKELLLNKVNSLGTFENELGDTINKYSFVGVEDDILILKSFEDWKDYGVKFEIKTDEDEATVEMDIENAFEAIATYTPKSDAFENEDDAEKHFESEVGNDVNDMIKDKHESLEDEKSELEESYETKLEEEKSKLEGNFEEKKSEIKEDFEAKKEEYESTISELTKFKDEQISKDKASFIRQVENLNDEEKQEFLDTRDDYSMEELVKEVKIFVADKVMSYSKNEDEIDISAIDNVGDKNFSKKSNKEEDEYLKWIEGKIEEE